MGLGIDYNQVKQVATDIRVSIGGNNTSADYASLTGRFTESKGVHAEAIQDLLKVEGKLSTQVDTTLRKFADKIEFVADEFKKLDQSMARQIK